MTERSTRPAEIELVLAHDSDALGLRFCDATVAQWTEPFGDLSEWTDKELVTEITDLIENAASDLAETLVRDLRDRVLADHAIRSEGEAR